MGWAVWRKALEILQEAWSTMGILKWTGRKQDQLNLPALVEQSLCDGRHKMFVKGLALGLVLLFDDVIRDEISHRVCLSEWTVCSVRETFQPIYISHTKLQSRWDSDHVSLCSAHRTFILGCQSTPVSSLVLACCSVRCECRNCLPLAFANDFWKKGEQT